MLSINIKWTFKKIEIDFYTFFQLNKQENMSPELEIIENSEEIIEDDESECEEDDPTALIRDFTDQEKSDAQRFSDEMCAEFKEPVLRALRQRSLRGRNEIKSFITDVIIDSITPEMNDIYKDRNIVKTLILVNQPHLEYCYAPEPDDGNDLLYALVTLTTCNELNIIDFEDKIADDFLR